MSEIKKVNNDFSVAGQVTQSDLKQAAEEGFKSVLNLRSPDESTYQADEQAQAQTVGLTYANVPLSPSVVEPNRVEAALNQLHDLPTPVLVHCGAGLRATAITLIALAKQQNWTLEKLTKEAEYLGFSLDQPHLQQFIQETYSDVP
jgi:uncharacterized protein (TIGR01244 family)